MTKELGLNPRAMERVSCKIVKKRVILLLERIINRCETTAYFISSRMLDALISSKTRIKLMLKFFLNPESSAYLRSLEGEFGDSTNSIRLELNRFEEADMIHSHAEGNRKIFTANTAHPLFQEMRSIVMKHTGIDQIVDHVVQRLGNVKKVFLAGELARGINTDIIDLVIIGDPEITYLVKLIHKAEKLAKRKIRYLIYSEKEANNREFAKQEFLLLWEAE